MWEACRFERAVLLFCAFVIAGLVAVLCAFLNIIYGVEFDPASARQWLISVLIGIVSGVHQILQCVVIMSNFVAADVVCGCASDALFSQPVISMVKIVVHFLIEIRDKNVEMMIFEQVRVPTLAEFDHIMNRDVASNHDTRPELNTQDKGSKEL